MSFFRNFWFVNQGAPKEEGHGTQQNDLQNMPFCFDLGSFFVQDPFFKMKIPTLEKGMKISLVAGNGKKTLKSQRNRQQFQTCLIWWFVKCAPKKTFPKPTRGELKCDKPTRSTKIHVMKHNTRVDSNNEKHVLMLPCFQNTFDFFEGDLSTWSIEYCYHQSYRILRTNCWLHFQIANFKKFPATKQQRPTSPWWQCQPLYLVAGLFLFKKPTLPRERSTLWNETCGASFWLFDARRMYPYHPKSVH